ncbi:DUF2304 domain-containing protein [Marinicella sp. S1101]|uniref:DUF2304 domain-containing protein n=1 Tax=Marinicella marina TaxID=2996016 RepID=UPI002260B4A4|nr:DUF2304 domain-containing protein [Marinicella marina]MCX7553950.1 DUF2304 domain-containing protein [Marinicella marina]
MTNLTILIIGSILSISILYLVRKGKMHGPYATWWLLVALSAIILSIFPQIIDWVAARLGITYPPTLLLVLSVSMILIRMLTMDMALTRKERKIRRLTQKMAILEAAIEQPECADEKPKDSIKPIQKSQIG